MTLNNSASPSIRNNAAICLFYRQPLQPYGRINEPRILDAQDARLALIFAGLSLIIACSNPSSLQVTYQTAGSRCKKSISISPFIYTQQTQRYGVSTVMQFVVGPSEFVKLYVADVVPVTNIRMRFLSLNTYTRVLGLVYTYTPTGDPRKSVFSHVNGGASQACVITCKTDSLIFY